MNYKKIIIFLLLIILVITGSIILTKQDLLDTKVIEGQNWKIHIDFESNDNVLIFRPSLYSKFATNEPVDIIVSWHFNSSLNLSQVNNPQLYKIYKVQEYPIKQNIMVDLEHFNFKNNGTTDDEILSLLSDSFVLIEWENKFEKLKLVEIWSD